MKLFKDLSIQKTIVSSITIILAISVLISVVLSYKVMCSTTKGLVYEQASEINKQIVLNYENYTSRVNNIANIIQKKLMEYDIGSKQDKENIRSFFEGLEEIEGSIGAIALFDSSAKPIIATRPVNLNEKEIALKDWFKNAIYNDDILHFKPPHMQDVFDLYSEEVITVSRAIRFSDRGLVRSGVILIDMKFESLDSLSKITNLGKTGHIIILDDEDNIVYSSNRGKYTKESKSYNIIKETIFGRSNANIDGKNMAININTISSTRWRIATFQNIEAIDTGIKRAIYIVIPLVIATMLITIFIAYIVASKITKPLKKLDHAIMDFRKGNYDTKVDIEGQKEVKIVSEGFNEMIDEIQRLMDAIVKEQENKRQTEITILQNQINPHFLYNTLDCIIWLAEEKRNDDLVATVNALSTFFRVSLSKGRQFIPIVEELRHIESYMLIQSIRYNDCFSYEINCQESLKKLLIMKLLLQPIVENAIYHGIDKEEEDSFIKIDVFSEGDKLVLRVINSGYGISKKRISEILSHIEKDQEGGGLGLKNVYKRLKLFYGPKANLKIESELDESTTISIIIPKESLKEEDSYE